MPEPHGESKDGKQATDPNGRQVRQQSEFVRDTRWN
jgi:hypothetical protein